MSLPALPVELIDNILQNVSTTDLVALSRTCTSLGPVAQRLLYRNIAVSPWSRNISVVAILAKRPDLAHYVRSFSVSAASTASPLFPAFYRLLATALSGMTEVTSLNLTVDSSTSWILGKATQHVNFHRLQQFTCSFPFDFHVANFLEKTPALLELEVDSMPYEPCSSIPSISATTIPRLAQFVGSARVARVIVPGRPLQSIHLNEGDLVEEDVACLARASANVVVLGATASEPPVPLLESIARHLPHLAYLRIMTTYHFAHAPEMVSLPMLYNSIFLHFNLPTIPFLQGFMDQVANALATLPDLTAFELSGMQWGSSKREDSKRVWQSAPLSTTFNRSEETTPDDAEIFLQY